MRMTHNFSCFLLYAVFFFIFSGCLKPETPQSNDIVLFNSYRDIPGVTGEEIADIEEFRKLDKPFIYGMLIGTETFLNANGEIRGYTALLCEWLSKLFGISFVPKHFSWFPLLDALENGEADFTGELTANEERRKTYYMTDAIAQRSIKYFRVAGSAPLPEIARIRQPRYILQEKNTVTDDVLNYAAEPFEPVYVTEYNEAYDLLNAGKGDAIITEGVQEAFFDNYGDIITSNFFPLIFSPVSLSTQNPRLASFISVVQKALENGGIRYLNKLYDDGYYEYLNHKLYTWLSDEEKEYIINNPVIPFAAEYDNYPVSFYSVRYKEWRGICFDVLKEIQSLSGLNFLIVNNDHTEFHELLGMLEAGDTYILSEVVRSPEREGRFLWPYNSFMAEKSALISRIDYPNINVNRVYSESVGISRGTVQAEFFQRWFPNHLNTVVYESQSEVFEALLNGEIDLVMNSYSALLYLTNYQELAGFKANILFDNSFESTFGINKDQGVLCSIIDKALELIDTNKISEQWRHKTYDYRLKIAQARTPWLIGSIILTLFVLSLAAVLLLRSRHAGKEMEVLVRKRTYELALQTTTLTTLFDSIPDLIFTKNLDLNFLHCNKALLEHFNKDIDDLVGKNDLESLNVAAEAAEAFNRLDRYVISEQKTIKVEERIPRFDGSNPLYETIKMPLMLDKKVVGVMGISRDITMRKEVEEAALAASQSKSSFLANMSHEIRTPMNAILGITEILIQHNNIPFDIKEGLGKIYSSCDLLLGIINDILDFSKIEAGKLDIIPSKYKVASMINDSVHLNMMRINSKPIEFELRIDENVPSQLIGDELRNKQILNNLLSNAFKYTDSGKVKLSVISEPIPESQMDSTLLDNGDTSLGKEKIMLVLSVQDTGHGMTQEQLGRMFEEYSRFNQSKKTTVEGTGLGLAITQRLVNLMGGKMFVESEPGVGTFFIIRLPQVLVDSEVLGKEVVDNLRLFRTNYFLQKRRGQIKRDPMPYGSILIVDDVETNLYVAVGLMKLYKLQIDTAMSGREAINKIKSGKNYDVIFLDHMMPVMSGIETIKKIREMGCVVPVVALTANAVSGQADMFFQNGFDEFISKPIDIRQLNLVLNKFVRDKQPPEVIEAALLQYTEINDSNDNQKIDPLMLESFIRDARKTIDCWEEQVKPSLFSDNGFDDSEEKHESNIEALNKFTVIIHGIKSSLWNIGETVLAEFASRLEAGGRNQNFEVITAHSHEFMDELRVMLEKIQLRHDVFDSDFNDEEYRDLHEKLLEIKERCADYDRKGVMEIIAKIKKCPKKTRAVLDSIMEYALHSEFEEAESAAAVHLSALALNKDNA